MKKLLAVAAALGMGLSAAAFSVCAVGDSITEGGSAFVAHRVALENLFKSEAYGWDVEWKGSHKKNGSGSDNLCEGYSGKNAAEIATNYVNNANSSPDALAADLLLLHAGHNFNNDPSMSSPAYMQVDEIVAHATNAHAQIIAKARELNENVIVLYAKVITSGGNEKNTGREIKYSYITNGLNQAIGVLGAQLNTEKSPVVVVDMAKDWKYDEDCVIDHVHPTAGGAKKMAEKWMEAINHLVDAGKLTVTYLPNAVKAADWIGEDGKAYTALKSVTGTATANGTGGSWVVTDITPACTNVAKTKFKMNGTSWAQGLWCARTSDYKQQFSGFFLSNTIRCDRNGVQKTGSANPGLTNCLVVADYAAGKFSINGTETDIGSTADYTVGSPLMFFASNNGAAIEDGIASNKVGNRGAYDFYWFQLRQPDGALEHNLLPARRDADLAVGLYDTQTGAFYPQADNRGSDFAVAERPVVGEGWKWTGLGGDGLMSNPDNWEGGLLPDEAEGLDFTLAPAGSEIVSDLDEYSHDVWLPLEDAPTFTGDGPLTFHTKFVRGDTALDGVRDVQDGGIVVDGERTAVVFGDSVRIGQNTGTEGYIEVNNGSVRVMGDLVVGNYGAGTLTISGGTVEVDPAYTTFPAYAGGGSSGSINLDGGVLVTKRVARWKGSAYVNFNGGTLKANAANDDFIKSGVAVSVGPDGGTIDCGGNDITINATLGRSGDAGGLTFTGGGTVTLAGRVSYPGATRVTPGTTLVATMNATKDDILSRGLVVEGVPTDGQTIFTLTREGYFLSEGDLANVTCPGAPTTVFALSADNRSIVVGAAGQALALIDLSALDASKAIAGTSAAGSPAAYSGRGALYAFNGAGMNADGTHGTTADGAMFMFSQSNSGSFPWYIQVDLGETRRIDAVNLYNLNFTKNGNAYTSRGVKNFKLYVSTGSAWETSVDGIQWNYSLALSGELAEASGEDGYAGERFTLPEPVNARFVALVALDDWDDSFVNMNFNGIAEIRLFSGGDPLPDSDPPPVVESCLVEAEAFSNKGGWVVDPQFVEQMGSPYLLAHGKGIPVDDARTTVNIAPGRVRAYVRTRDWTPDWDGEKPGRFQVVLGGKTFPATLGVAPATWGWVDAGVVEVGAGPQVLALHDLTGFEGRCDAIYLCPEDTAMPPDGAAELAAWRAEMHGEAGPPDDVVSVDFVVVGGGMAGTGAAVAAAEAGLSVALVQDRPVLGGNASDEIRVNTCTKDKEFHWIVKAIHNTGSNAGSMAADDAARMSFVRSYQNIDLNLGWRAYGVVTNAERKIVAVDARNVETGARRRFVAPLFCDATGDGWIAYWAGAAYMLGREAKDEYDEPQLGQDLHDASTMGNSLMWTTKTQEAEYKFPDVPWATKVSGSLSALSGGWTWEAGLDPNEDTIDDAEMLRDRLFRAIYGSFWTAKQKTTNAKRVFNWVPYIAGKRESRRIIGDYVVSEKDVTECRQFEDAVGIATWTIDLHWAKGDSGFITSTTHTQVDPWWLPYRSLCCRDVPNLFLAGRCASYTHIAFGSSRVMHTCGQQGVAVGFAAALCKDNDCMPRAIYQDPDKMSALQSHLNLRQLEKHMTEYDWPEPQPYVRELWTTVVDNADAAGVEISGEWTSSSYSGIRYGADYLHNNKAASDDLWVRYTPNLPSNATYVVSLTWNCADSRSTAVPVEVTHAGGTVTNYVDMTKSARSWTVLGAWSFAEGTSGSVRILTAGTNGKFVVADAVKFAIAEVFEPSEDTDRNGLPDAWERMHFLRTTGTDPNGDPDGDGQPNIYEYIVGSDPNVVNRPFSVDAILTSDVGIVSLVWKGVAGRAYQVKTAENVTGPYVDCGSPVVANGDGECALEIPVSDARQAFFKIDVSVR